MLQVVHGCLRVVSFVLGLFLLIVTMRSALMISIASASTMNEQLLSLWSIDVHLWLHNRQSVFPFVLSRPVPEMIVRFWFWLLRWLFDLRLRWTNDYLQRDCIMALYAPIALISRLPS